MASNEGKKVPMERNPDGTMKKGSTANPHGAPPRPNWTARLRHAAENDSVEVMHTMIEAAKEGDTSAAKLVLERVVPPLKPVSAPVHVEGVEGSLTDKAGAILTATADGRLSPDTAGKLITAVGQLAKVAEVDELERRIQALEGGSDGNTQ